MTALAPAFRSVQYIGGLNLNYRKCEGCVDVVGVVTPLVRGGAQVLHGD